MPMHSFRIWVFVYMYTCIYTYTISVCVYQEYEIQHIKESYINDKYAQGKLHECV